jgi:hypothetical protein
VRPGAAEVEGVQVQQSPGRPGSGRRSRRGLRVASAAALLTATGVAGAVLGVPAPTSWQGFQENLGSTAAPQTLAPPVTTTPARPPADPSSAVPSSAVLPPDRPTPGGGTERLAPAPAAPVGGGPFTFVSLQANGATPVAYDPCRAVHYVIRPDQAPAGGEEMIHAAVARLSAATGLQFVYDGPSDEALAGGREAFQPARYGDRWAPVLVVWQTDAENAALAGDVVGQGGSTSVSLGNGPRVYVTGTVALDAGQFPDILERSDGRAVAEAIVLHEFAHLVGLGHVDDETQLMNPETVPGVTDLAAGDRTGLARLGRGSCEPDL